MNYKLKAALKRNRISFIVIVILWVLITIVFVAPLACGIVEAMQTGKLDLAILLQTVPTNITSPFSTIAKAFSDTYIGTFGNTLGIFTIFYAIVCIIGLVRAMPKMNIPILNMVLVLGANMESNISYLVKPKVSY